MSAVNLSRRMSAEDAWFLYFEKPDAPLHIGSVGVYEGEVSFEALHASMDARMHLIPRYRQRAIIPPLFAGHPTWEDDPEFSLDRHLRFMRLDAPGTMEQLIELSSPMFAEMLPRDRPLWDMTVVHGLEGGKSALISRVHHCLVDGASGIELLLAVMDMVPNPEPTPAPAEQWEPKQPPNPLQSWSDAIVEQWNSNLRAISELQRSMMDPRGQFRAMTDFSHAVEVALPTALRRPVRAPWNKPVGKKRRVAWTELNFQEVRGIRSRLGGTVNDVVLTVLGGAFGRYLRTQDVRTDGLTLRFMIPVNVRAETEQGALGNRVSMMLPEVPVGAMTPADRLAAVRAEMERRKTDNQAGAFEALRRFSENVPAVMHAMAGIGGVPPGGANLVCTNVPGPLIPLYSVGHRMTHFFPMLPLVSDMGLGVAVTSYDKALYMGVMSDPDLVPDVETIRRFVDEEFELLRTIAEVPVSDLGEIGVKGPARNSNGSVPRDLRAERSTPLEPKAAATAPTVG